MALKTNYVTGDAFSAADQNALNALVNSLSVAAVTRTLSYCNGGMGGVVTPNLAAATQWGFRTMVRLPETTTAWRFKCRNYDMTSVAKTALIGKGLIMGTPGADNADGSDTGNFLGGVATTLISSDFTIPGDGTFYTSLAYTLTGQQFTAGQDVLLALSYTMASTAMQTTAGHCYLYAVGANAINPAYTTAPTSISFIPLDFQIEYQTTSTRGAWLVVGDSIPEGISGPQGTGSGSIVPRPIHSSYPALWAAQRNGLVTNISLAGMTANVFGSTSTYPEFWSRTDFTNSAFTGALVCLGSNDSTAGVTLAAFQASMAQVLTKLRTIIGTKPIYVALVAARGTGTALLTSYNAWLATLPYGIAGVVDLHVPLRSSSSALIAEYTVDTIHLSDVGAKRAAMELASVLPPPSG